MVSKLIFLLLTLILSLHIIFYKVLTIILISIYFSLKSYSHQFKQAKHFIHFKPNMDFTLDLIIKHFTKRLIINLIIFTIRSYLIKHFIMVIILAFQVPFITHLNLNY